MTYDPLRAPGTDEEPPVQVTADPAVTGWVMVALVIAITVAAVVWRILS